MFRIRKLSAYKRRGYSVTAEIRFNLSPTLCCKLETAL